jgi:hypothetical protein
VYADPATLVATAPRDWPVLMWSTDNRKCLFDAMKLRLHGFSVFRYWVGGDVLRMTQAGRMARRFAVLANRLFCQQHLTNAPWLSDELGSVGLHSVSIPVSPICCADHWPLTPVPALPYRVIYYSLPDNDHIYLPEIAAFCAESVPEIEIVCVGHPNPPIRKPNVTNVGILGADEMRQLYARCHCLMRITSHDGLARSVLEALGNGLDVVTNLNVPHTVRATSREEAANALRSLCRGRTERSVSGRNWVLAEHSAESFVGKLTTQLNCRTARVIGTG